ncbi:MAG: ATP-binding protein [Syntrophales bacterium]|jgi:two-component system NtrC family sensor kinase
MQTSGTVLVVDDSAFICKTVCHAIEPSGYTVLTAVGGKEALQILSDQGERIDVVITDVIMPVIDGVELMGKIHELYPDLPVILMTAYSNIDIVITAIKKHAFDLILKPVDATLLQLAVEKALKQKNLLYLEKNYLETLKQTVKEKTRELQMKMTELEEARTSQSTEHEKLKVLFRKVQVIKEEWERTMDCIGDMVLLVDPTGKIRRCNQALRLFVGKSYMEILGTDLQELILTHSLTTRTTLTSGTELFHAPSGRWFIFTEYPFTDRTENENRGTVITIHDTTELKITMDALGNAYKELQATQAQVLHNEKMASIGQLAAGVAHEINNPIGFVSSNLGTLGKYLERLTGFMTSQARIVEDAASPEAQQELATLRQSLKIDRIIPDIGKLISESLDGANRVHKIVQDLNTFSRVDQGNSKVTDLVACLESAITIVWNELKYKATLKRNYGNIPPINCYPQQLNQVFMNLLVNAGHSIESQGLITITTWSDNETANVSIGDTGCGIAPEHLNRIFEPFFTTKEVGKGTGLGLSISYDIIQKHHGEITVESTVGAGTTFTVKLPLGNAEP